MMYQPNPGVPPVRFMTIGSSAANTLNMIVDLYLPTLASLDQRWMHLRCWKMSGRFGRWIKHPGGNVKCDHCGKTIANRGEQA